MSADATNVSCHLKIIFASPSDHRQSEPQRWFTDNTPVTPESAATNDAIFRLTFLWCGSKIKPPVPNNMMSYCTKIEKKYILKISMLYLDQRLTLSIEPPHAQQQKKNPCFPLVQGFNRNEPFHVKLTGKNLQRFCFLALNTDCSYLSHPATTLHDLN